MPARREPAGNLSYCPRRLTGVTSQRRRRIAAIAGTAVAILALAGGVVALVQQQSGKPGNALHQPTAKASTPATSPSPSNNRELDRFAAKAPCQGGYADPEPVYAAPQPPGQAAVRNFDAVAVVRCQWTSRRYPGDGEWALLVRQVGTRGLPGLIKALTQPSQRQTNGPCAAIAYVLPPLYLVDAAGKYLHPAPPTDGCGAPLPGFAHAIAAMTWRTVSTTKLNQVQSQQSIDTGCAQQWKNEAEMYARFPMRPDPGHQPVLAHVPDTALHVCIYRTGSDPEIGNLERGTTLSRQQSEQLRTALAGPGRRGDCASQRAFAVVDNSINVELGGCWRVVRNDVNPVTIGTADPALVKQLLDLR